MKKIDVGGQAVIEGVMMRGTKGIATAVRTSEGKIEVDFLNQVPITKKYSILNIPFIRGFFVFLDSLVLGIKSLNFSASFFEDTEPSKFEAWFEKKFGDKSNDILMYISLFISFIFAMGLFVLLPTFIASLFRGIVQSSVILNVIEAIIRIVVLLAYMIGVGQLEDIKRLYQYHGAEHKTIFCYECGEDLTVDNVRKFSRFHPRCGTNFIFLIMFTSIAVFSFTSFGSVGERLIIRLVLLPVITGITYELIKWLGRNEGNLSRIVASPGLQLQKLTTKEPDDDQIEVAIRSLREAEDIRKSIGKLLKEATEIFKKAEIDTAVLDAQILLAKTLNKDKLYVITNKEELVSFEKEEEFFKYVRERELKKPISYITENVEFMGIDFYVKEGVLIPRGDTEILVEEVLDNITEDSEIEVCDLCTGSGAIGLSLASFRKNIHVDCIDIEQIPEEVTKENIRRLNLQDRVNFLKSNLLEKPLEIEKKYNVIVSNPPYIREDIIETLMEDVKNYEPHVALSGGEDGLLFYRRIVEESTKVLAERGILAFEIGYDQGDEVKEIMEAAGFKDVKIKKDLAGLDRVVVGGL
ncbi:peptide chain release factor N(5)-glutamine methyltransferase [Clostridium sp. 'White wine YQ']|uniref:peptide chain release factor N(5)-glutamine methyltransferase n=1 Tax=Clostridium sp. 'White wine YQ' TaxID=3027474 RepID=UPI002366A90B|nr:peptide chain release factor N(5)-glutamine methyltransferase [Clostridium sp. 'White wine YQ']MDD7792684.1 peptide chain release factor N(5)-glutamine methyltransferase [Clostridium sp. 'White wine YQ']